MKGKRATLARICKVTGAFHVLRRLPARGRLLVLNYHRIGRTEHCPFDEGVLSASPEQFALQMDWLARSCRVLRANEIATVGDNGFPNHDPCVLITFDDGYLDNYETAFPVLRRQGLSALFFIPSLNLVDPTLMWWDRIAYLVKNSPHPKLALAKPTPWEIELRDRGEATKTTLEFYKQLPGEAHAPFLASLEQAAGIQADWKRMGRDLFIDGPRLRAMIAGGMHVGAHTHSHEILSALNPSEQRSELRVSKEILDRETGQEVNAMSYPVGGRSAFTEQTKQIAKQCGYAAAFSFYGGFNSLRSLDSYDIRRVGVSAGDALELFQARVLFALRLGFSI